MADAGLLEQVIVDVDLEAKVPCGYQDPCENEAEWRWHCPCGQEQLLCDEHLAAFHAYVARLRFEAYLCDASCRSCGRMYSMAEVAEGFRPI